MATKVVPTTLTIVHEEKITLNGVEKGSKVTQVIADVTEVDNRVIAVPTSEIEILTFQATNPGAGTFDEADVRYIRLTNLDDTNYIQLTFKDDANQEFAVKLDYGQTFVYNGDNAGGTVDTMDADEAALTVSFQDMVSIYALANTAECDLELFVAGV